MISKTAKTPRAEDPRYASRITNRSVSMMTANKPKQITTRIRMTHA